MAPAGAGFSQSSRRARSSALAATGQPDMAAAGQIRLAVVN